MHCPKAVRAAALLLSCLGLAACGGVPTAGTTTIRSAVLSSSCKKLGPDTCARRCEEGDGASCNALGAIVSAAGDQSASFEAYRRACALGSLTGCSNAAVRLLSIGAKEREEWAVDELERTCAEGDAYACGDVPWAARKIGRTLPRSKTTELLDTGCSAGNLDACAERARNKSRGAS